MQYESVFKSDGLFMLYLPSSYCSAAAQTGQKTAAPGTGTGAPPVAQRLLTKTWPKQYTIISIHANTNKN